MIVTSPTFAEGGAIPIQYTGDSSDFAPALEWSGAPEATAAFAMTCEDPDAPGGTWIHWVVYNIPGAAYMLAPKLPRMAEHPSGLRQGLNSWGRLGYNGPCPPSGTHRYIFTVHALDTVLDLAPEATFDQLQAAMQGHILDSGRTTGVYGR